MMAVDFPSSPTEGQLFASEGGAWRFKNGVWAAISNEVQMQDIVGSGLPATGWTVIGDTLIQWGQVAADAVGKATITFPKAFKTANPIVTAVTVYGLAIMVSLRSPTATAVALDVYDTAGAGVQAYVAWHAIGEALDADKKPKSVGVGSSGMTEASGDVRYLKLTGGHLTGGLTVDSGVVIRPYIANTNAHLYFRRFNDTASSLIYYDYAADSLALMRYAIDGSTNTASLSLTHTDATLYATALGAPVAGSLMTMGRSDARYLALTGGTVMDIAANNTRIKLQRSAAANSNVISFADVNGSDRWVFAHGAEPNGAFHLQRRDAAGGYLDTPLAVSPTGGVNVVGTFSVGALNASSSVYIVLNRANDTVPSVIQFRNTNGNVRWQWVHDGAVEGAFRMQRHDINATYLDSPLVFSATGGTTLCGPVFLTPNVSAGSPSLTFTKSSFSARSSLMFRDFGGAPRWAWHHMEGADSAFLVERYNASGGSLGAAFTINLDASIVTGSTLTATGSLKTLGHMSHQGSAGAYLGNLYNFAWSGGFLQGWVDTTNLGNVTFASDYRIKKDIEPLPPMWDVVLGLRPVRYTQAEYQPPEATPYLDDDGNEIAMFQADDEERWGFVAHELQEDLIHSAATGRKDEPNLIQSPNPFTLLAALTGALQESMAKIEELMDRVAQLESAA